MGLIGLVVLASGAWLGSGVARRAQRGYDEVAAALRNKEFTSDTGARLLLNWWAIEAIAEHPVQGVGAGGYRPWVIDHLRARNIDPASRRLHAHAHNGVLHAGATTGLVGAALLAGAVLCGLACGRPRRGETWALDAGPAAALLGLIFVSAFDTVQVNAQTAAVLCGLLGLCNDLRPPGASVR
jgi:O-antigen ligase